MLKVLVNFYNFAKSHESSPNLNMGIKVHALDRKEKYLIKYLQLRGFVSNVKIFR